MEKITELGAHKPSVESVISRLNRFEDKIESITVIVEWKDESSDIFHNEKDVKDLCYESVIFNEYIRGYVFNAEPEE